MTENSGDHLFVPITSKWLTLGIDDGGGGGGGSSGDDDDDDIATYKTVIYL